MIIGLVPWWLARRPALLAVWTGGLADWLGAWLILEGLGLAGWCVALFWREGQGSPLPLAPPTRFVAVGPYRFVRNPMMLGMWVILLGEALLYNARAVWLYAALITALGYLYIVAWEEPELQRRFSPLYLEYKRQVPRWLPRPFSRAPSL